VTRAFIKKTILLLSLGLLLVAPAVPRLISLYVGPEAIRLTAASFLGGMLGREVTVRGRAALTLLPRPSIVIEDISVANPPGYDGEMFFARQARLEFRLASLLSRRIDCDSLTLFGAQLDVSVDGRGASNWHDVLSGARQVISGAASKDNPELTAGFTVDSSKMRIVLADGEITYRDLGRGTLLRLTGLRCALDQYGGFSVHFAAPGAFPGLDAEAEAAGMGAIDPVTEGLEVRNARLSVVLRAAAQGVSRQSANQAAASPLVTLGAVCDFTQAAQRLNLAGLTLEMPGVKLSGRAGLSHADDPGARRLNFDLAAESCDLGVLLAAFPKMGAELLSGGASVLAEGSLGLGKLSLGELAVHKLAARVRLGEDKAVSALISGHLADGEFTADASVVPESDATDLSLTFGATASGSGAEGAGGRGAFGSLRARLTAAGASGRLDLHDTSFGEAARAFGLPYRDFARFDGLGPVSGGASFAVIPSGGQPGENGLELSDIEWRWPDFEAKGKATLVLPALRGLSFTDVFLGARGVADLSATWGQAQAPAPVAALAPTPVPDRVPVPYQAHSKVPVKIPAPLAAKGAPAKPGPQTAKATARVQFTSHPTEVKEAKQAKPAPGFDLAVQLSFDDPSGPGQVRADLAGLAGFDPQTESWRLKNAKIDGKTELRLPALSPLSVAHVAFKGRLEADFGKGSAEMTQATLDAGFAKGDGHLSVASLWEDPKFTGTLNLAEFSPRQAAAALSLNLPGEISPKALAKARGSFDIAADAKEIALRRVRMLLDSTNISGQAAYVPKTRAVTFDLDADEIELSNYLSSAPASQTKTLTGHGGQSDTPYNTAAWRDLNIEGRVRVAWFRREGLVFKQPDISVSVKNGQFRAELRSRDFYGGRFSAEFRAQALDRGMSSCADLKLDDVDADAFLRDLTGDLVVTGRGSASVSVCGRGESEAAWWREVSGSAGLIVRQGVMPLRESGRTPKNPADVEQIAFRVMSASFRIAKGVATTEDVVLDGPKLTAKGRGWVNLIEETLDLALNAVYEGSAKVPVGIKGPILEPKLDIDRSAAVGDTIFRIFNTIVSTPENTYRVLRKFIF
jgi:uncharacterized protein involved in outer membrane biogenesis